MRSPWVQSLRSVAFDIADLAAAEAFYTETWRLVVVDRSEAAVYLRGTGTDHHLLALHGGHFGPPQLRHITLRARSETALASIAAAVPAAGGRVEYAGPALDPAGGQALRVVDADGRRFEIVHGDVRRTAEAPATPDRPVRLAHAVLNSHDVAGTQCFLEAALGFVLADRTQAMAFMNCDADHHSIALGDADNDALNHIAFLMPTLDAVMRGGGRMKDAGLPSEWGPGRHGPGNNAFNYFIDPFGIVIEYTAEVEQIDDSYVARGPADWTWPAGRVDQWGTSPPPSARIKAAQRKIRFAPSL